MALRIQNTVGIRIIGSNEYEEASPYLESSEAYRNSGTDTLQIFSQKMMNPDSSSSKQS